MFFKLFVVLIAVSFVKSSVIHIDIETDENPDSLTNCNERDCNNICTQLGFDKGICRDGQCYCVKQSDVKPQLLASLPMVKSCNLRACDQLCRRLGFTGGVCLGDRCSCDNFTPLKDIKPKLPLSMIDGCNNRACDQLCRRLGFTGGVCLGDRCSCDNFAPLSLSETENKHFYSTVKSCFFPDCDQTCRDRGYSGGYCWLDRCKCVNFTSPSELKPTISNQDSLSNEGSCNFQACDQLCRNLGFPGGACVGDRCDCDNFKPQVSKSCNLRACEQLCHNLGLKGGICLGDRCSCDNFKPIEEFLNLFIKNKKNEEEHSDEKYDYQNNVDAPTVPGNCDVVACNEQCHRMNYIGGLCFAGNCKCY